MVTFRLLDRFIGLFSTIILARLLAPGDFGLIAMSMTLIAAIELITAFGFDTALIQRSDARQFHYDSAWTLNIALGIASSLVLAGLAYPKILRPCSNNFVPN